MTTDYYDGLPAVTTDGGDLSPTIDEIAFRVRHMIALLNECLIDPPRSPDDLSALTWIMQSLEDIEATITGLAHRQYQHAHLPPVFVYQPSD